MTSEILKKNTLLNKGQTKKKNNIYKTIKILQFYSDKNKGKYEL